MTANYVLLEKITVGAAGASNVTFSGIPQTGYTDLVIKMSTRRDSGANDGIGIRFNGSSAGNYSMRNISGDGTSAASANAAAVSAIYGYGTNNWPTATASTFSNAEFYIPNYTSSNAKSVSLDGAIENNATSSYMALTAGVWSLTSAITSIDILPLSSGSFVQYSTFYLYGVAKYGTTPAIAPKATGGDTIMTDGTYWYHAFKADGTFTPATILSCDVLVVAGGGGGGAMSSSSGTGAGGGGAGGVLYTSGLSLSAGTPYNALVGSGGAGGTGGTNPGVVGNNSTFISAAAIGGGGGGRGNTPGGAGGSGGGGTDWGSGGSSAGRFGGAGTAGQGNSGGTTNARFAGGGGGGAGGAGLTNVTSFGGAGGVGTSSYVPWLTATGTGVNNLIAGGGGGGNDLNCSAVAAAGGSGGGGNGGYYVPNPLAQLSPTAGTANTGGGGGGAGGTTMDGAAGGSGLVIVRYAV